MNFSFLHARPLKSLWKYLVTKTWVADIVRNYYGVKFLDCRNIKHFLKDLVGKLSAIIISVSANCSGLLIIWNGPPLGEIFGPVKNDIFEEFLAIL